MVLLFISLQDFKMRKDREKWYAPTRKGSAFTNYWSRINSKAEEVKTAEIDLLHEKLSSKSFWQIPFHFDGIGPKPSSLKL